MAVPGKSVHSMIYLVQSIQVFRNCGYLRRMPAANLFYHIKFVTLLFGLILAWSDAIGQESYKNILIFFGDNETRPAYGRIVEGIRSSFPKGSTTTINIIQEYLDLERFSDRVHVRQVVDMYNTKVRESAIDLIITVSPGAYDALKEYGLELLHQVPVIALEMNVQDKKRYSTEFPVVELLVEWNPQQSLEHAFALFPACRHAIIIGGCSASDRMFTAGILKAASYFKETHQLSVLSCVSMDTILEVVHHAPDSTLVFMSSLIFDADSNRFSSGMAISLVTSQSAAPVFTMSDNFIDYGGLGGYVISFLDVGKKAGLIARELLEQDSPGGLRKISSSYYLHQYNWKELKKWNLVDSKVIPSNSAFYFRDFNFFTFYRWQIAALGLFIILQTVLIYYLIRLSGRQKKVFWQKAENEKLYRKLVREDRVSMVSQLTASMAHELNQPLAAILFNAQAGLRFLESGKLDAQQAEVILTGIVEDDKRASGIISSVRNLMKMETRVKEKVDLVDILKETLRILHLDLERQQIQVIFVDTMTPVYVNGDKIQLQQVIMNLLLNSGYALSQNDRSPKQIQIRLKHNKSQITLAIEDNGPGIDEALLDKIFDGFVTTKEDGMGIGLAICKSIIQNHGGKITAWNKPAGGAVFSITLQSFTHGI